MTKKQPDLFGEHVYKTGLPSVPGDTSEGAAESVESSAKTLRIRVFRYIAGRAEGSTCDEAEAALQMSHQTCSARVRELVLLGLLEDSGDRRPTRTGRGARVYKALPEPVD